MDWSRRIRRVVLRWLWRRPGPIGVESLFTESPLAVTSLDPANVGRQRMWMAAVTDTVAWLEANGWSDVGRGDLQRYAAYLLEKRAAYERQGALIS